MPTRVEDFLLSVVLVCSFVVNPTAGAANLDSMEPIVKVSPGDWINDEFGYSVLLHRFSSPPMNTFESYLNSTRLVVGAPHGTYPGGLPLPALNTALNNTGLVYQCPIGQGKCERIGSTDTPLFDGTGNTAMENKTGQLMGSVLYGEGNYFIACAPLYVVFSLLGDDLDDSRPVGRCFVSSNDLQSFNELRPCAGTSDVNPSSTIGTNQQCLSGFSTVVMNANSTTGTVVVAAPGSRAFAGNLFYFANATGPVTAQTGNLDGSTTVTYQYEGYSTTIGDIINVNSQDIITGAPRLDGTTLFGGVRIRPRSDIGGIPTVTLQGSQTGEYYGAAVVAADLNNDGYDELVVGAPIYSSGRTQESGRVYVYRNMGGLLNETNPIVLEGPSVQSRFGSSIVNLGDINGDGLEDIAIGAPYEGYSETSSVSGTVYIHYGSNFGDDVISTTANQVIRAQNVVDSVPSITSLQGFGFSLSSGVDVDGNEFNDLLVGAHISGTAVLFRSLSVANIEIVNITTSSKTLQLNTVTKDATPFTVRVCARYSGRGFNNRPLTVNLGIGEVTTGPSRIFFNPSKKEENSAVFEFRFSSTDSPSCDDNTVYGKSLIEQSRRLDILSPIELQVSFSAVTRPPPDYVEGSPRILTDFRDIPIIILQGNTTTSVFPSVNCSGNINGEEVCTPDLIVSLNDTVFLDFQDNRIELGVAVAGLVQSVQIELTYENIGRDPALGAEIQFTLPEGFIYASASVPAGSQDVTCQEDSSMPRVYTCLLANYIPSQDRRISDVDTRLTILWRVSRTLVGNEATQTSNITIGLTGSATSRDRESDILNNFLMNGPLTIMYEAVADLDIFRLMFTQTVANYRRNIVKSNPTITEIGRIVELRFDAVNRGPSNSPNTRVEVYIPTNDTFNRFYLYLTNATAMLDNGTPLTDCDFGGINPQNLPTSNTRRKRSVQKRQEQATSEAITSLPDIVRNCSDPEFRTNKTCTAITCNIPIFAISQRLEIVVRAALDDRFFDTVRAPYTFVAYGAISSNSSYVTDPDTSNNQNMTERYRVTLFLPPERVLFPFWIIIVIGVVFVILLILLFIILYFFGCFRRKLLKAVLDDDEPVTNSVKVIAIIPGNGIGEEKAPSGSPQSLKKAGYDESDEIGDASDLQMDDDPDMPVRDPDETSL